MFGQPDHATYDVLCYQYMHQTIMQHGGNSRVNGTQRGHEYASLMSCIQLKNNYADGDSFALITIGDVDMFVSYPTREYIDKEYIVTYFTDGTGKHVADMFLGGKFDWYDTMLDTMEDMYIFDTFYGAIECVRKLMVSSPEYREYMGDVKQSRSPGGILLPYGYGGVRGLIDGFIEAMDETGTVYDYMFEYGMVVAAATTGGYGCMGSGHTLDGKHYTLVSYPAPVNETLNMGLVTSDGYIGDRSRLRKDCEGALILLDEMFSADGCGRFVWPPEQ